MARKASLYARALAKALKEVPAKEQKAVAARFLLLLKKQGDMRHLSSSLCEFEKLWEARNGKPATLVSAGSLPRSVLSSLKKAVEKSGYLAKEAVNEKVIGGAAVFLGNDYIFDNTVKGKLQRMKEALKVS